MRGRRRECEALDQLLDAVRTGHSCCLVLRGEPGVGKTALLNFVSEQASGCRVARVAGVESEADLPFAGLQQLCTPMVDRLDGLPGPQQDALRVAFGLRDGGAPDRFLVGLAVLTLLSEAAVERPLVCLIDDAQWLDQASVQALEFVARRVMADPVAMVFAVREPADSPVLLGLPELVVSGLGDADARLLLESALQGGLDERVRDRFIAETRGNPLALLELPRGLSANELAGGFAVPAGQPLVSRIEHSFHRRLRALPGDTQRLLLTAAAEPIGDVVLLWRAAGLLGITPDAATAAEDAGLIDFGAARVRFHHPLVRSAVYQAASTGDRHAVHRALAEATDPEADPDRRAWHRASATVEPDEEVAGELVRSAARAEARGGVAAAAAFLGRATELTPDASRRGARAIAAAPAKLEAGAPDRASSLLATAEMGPLDELQRAQIGRLRARIAFAVNRGRDAPALLLAAAERLAPLDAAQARETYLEALEAAIAAGRLGVVDGVVAVAEAARAAPPAPSPPRPADLLLDGLTTRFTEGYAAALPSLQRALRAFLHDGCHSKDDLRWYGLASRVAPDLWDDESWERVASRQVELARAAGMLTVLPLASSIRAGVHVFAGEFAAASALVDEVEAIQRITGNAPVRHSSVLLAALRGQEGQTRQLIRTVIQDTTARGEGRAAALADYAAAMLDNSLGRYEEAFVAARRASEHEDLSLYGWVLTELVEAAVRSGRPEVAADALGRLAERTRASGTDWALGTEARSRALLTDGPAAEASYQEAIDRLARTREVLSLVRAHLVYGEWLRRESRRRAAREHLRHAHDAFREMGAVAFAERARRELLACGEAVPPSSPEARDELTAQEAQIARLAREGRTNHEIGAELFLSPRTVEWHLRKVFTKRGISSRREL
ncbi:LuxR family transcriptional regulator [Pseudonocardia yunnanensis]